MALTEIMNIEGTPRARAASHLIDILMTTTGRRVSPTLLVPFINAIIEAAREDNAAPRADLDFTEGPLMGTDDGRRLRIPKKKQGE